MGTAQSHLSDVGKRAVLLKEWRANQQNVASSLFVLLTQPFSLRSFEDILSQQQKM
jgi:uncharacterized membrane protein